MKILKPFICAILLFTLLASMSLNVFAAKAKATYHSATKVTYKITEDAASQKIIDITCNFKSLKKDKITIKNNSSQSVYIKQNNRMQKCLAPYASYTYTEDGLWGTTKDRIRVYTKTGKYTNYNILVTSTSGNIYFN